jgi:hypothetical protein
VTHAGPIREHSEFYEEQERAYAHVSSSRFESGRMEFRNMACPDELHNQRKRKLHTKISFKLFLRHAWSQNNSHN